MKIDIWSDIACPFCYLGQRRLELALADFAHRDDVEVVHHSFQLDPTAPSAPGQKMVPMLAAKFGTSEAQVEAMQRGIADKVTEVGLPYDWEKVTPVNTFDAHRLIHLAESAGRGDEAVSALFKAYFAEGKAVSDRDTLADIGEGIGLDRQAVLAMLDSDEYADAVRRDIQGAQSRGINGVPMFIVDDKLAVSGAQPTETFTALLERGWSDAHPIETFAAGGDTCTDDTCAV
ncbi:thioredoxin domain-containing protein [Epidermidibacterium keratini]|uniref:Thioredoxin domain-containing protein n=1 Tax=Epidermidibacterium keratini TaxID=1891644 RepID=A0A7L4YLM2_9ACTN|nr:DsbA family oxidoreductase [Epidermidibacterium keratini]QHB99772.1 thioredoxin domain-containing protein [Epidermidibacterium keratini]